MNKLYGTVVFGTANNKKFEDMLKRHKEQNLFKNDTLVAPGLKWKDIKSDCNNLPLHSIMNYVNQLWNKKRYVKDSINFRQKDYWQTPYQFSRVGGDCEDYAIAKMLTLKELGIENDMRLLIVKRNNEEHCVLALDEGDKTWILDNETNVIKEHQDYDCKLLSSIGFEKSYVHLYPKTEIA